jgi:hypothetical protein
VSEGDNTPAMLPLPGTPASSWARFRERFKAIFRDADPRVCAAFWLFGKLIYTSHWDAFSRLG